MRSYIDRGYIVVMQDVRGRFMSEGDFVHVRPAGYGETDETTDSYDTVEWLVKHVPHNNGRVGFAGSSYPGFYAMMGGLCTHPAVKAVSPQAPVTDWFMGDDVRHNGVLMLTDSYRFLSGMNTPPGHTPTEKMPPMSKRTRPDEWTFFREHATLAELTELQRPNPFWEELAEHSSYDAWWQARDLRRACYNVQPAVLVVGGSFDAEDCIGASTPLPTTAAGWTRKLDTPYKFPLRAPYGADDVSANPNVEAAFENGQYVYTDPVWWAGGSR